MSFLKTTLGKIIATFLISMVPVIELRGAIPYAKASGLNVWLAVAISIVGNLVPVPFIIIYIKKIFRFIRRHFPKFDGLITKLEKRAEEKATTVEKYEFWGLFILVAIPLPGTGAWTGALVAAMLDMRLKRALPAIAAGVVAAGAVVGLATMGVITLLI